MLTSDSPSGIFAASAKKNFAAWRRDVGSSYQRKGGRGRTELWRRAERTVQESQSCCCQRNGWGWKLLILKWLIPCPKQQPWLGFQVPASTKQEAGLWMSVAHVSPIVSAADSWPVYISSFQLGYRKPMSRSLPCLIWNKESYLSLIF